MMDLPLADEIREARRLAEEARDAQIHSSRIQAALASIDVTARTYDGGDIELPAEDLVDLLAERWTQLADLAAAGPRPTQPVREQLRMRRQQMEAALQFLSPIVRDAQRRTNVMSSLQHEQRHQLEDPRYADTLAELAVIGTERNDVQVALQPLVQRVGSLEPCGKVMATFIERLDWVTREELAFPGGTAWRSALVCRDLLSALELVLSQYSLELPLPKPVVVPDVPDPEGADALLADVLRVRSELQTLHEAVVAEHALLSVEARKVQQRYDELTQHVLDIMG